MKDNNSLFTGCFDVFRFTFRQLSKGKGFKLATFGITILFFLITFGINVGMAVSSIDKEKSSEIEKVYVVNETDFAQIEFKNLELTDRRFKDTILEEISSPINEIGENEGFLHITKSESKYNMELTISDTGEISKKEGNKFLDSMKSVIEQNKYINSGIEINKLILILSPVNSFVMEVSDQDSSLGEVLIKTILPMLLSFILYFMLLYYGQSIGKTMMAEKSSKLMEVLLVSVKPYAIVTGKILATALIALMQIFMWIAGTISGFILGNITAGVITDSYKNSIIMVVNLLKNNTDTEAFSTPVIIIAIIAVCLGFLFYSVLAGFIFSNVSKAEELSSGTSVFVIFIIIGFFASYFLTAFQSGYSQLILNVLRYVPIVSPFILPADILVGNIGILGAVISLLITLICTFALIILTGKVYKKRVFD